MFQDWDITDKVTVSAITNTINYIRKSREKRLITKEYIATHTHLNFKVKPALYSNAVVTTPSEIITVTQEASLPLNASLPVRHAH